MKLMVKILMSISTTIMLLKTPMSMGVLLITHTTISTMLLSKMLTSSWMPMIMFLMFIGGLLILFMYMSSIASNEKFKTNYKLIIVLLVFMLLLTPLDEFLMEIQMEDNLTSFIKMESKSLSKLFNKKTLTITLFLFMYMFLTMISVTTIISIYKGPLRAKKFYEQTFT